MPNQPLNRIAIPRGLLMLIAFLSLFVAFYRGVLLRHAGLSVLVTDGIQLLCAAGAVAIVVREIRIQLARERAANIPQGRVAKVGLLLMGAAALVVFLVLVIGKNR
jgi:hypothetical protein